MKTTLEFILPEEREELELALKGGEYHSMLFSVREDIRRWYKDFGSVMSDDNFWDIWKKNVGEDL
jgi:hypothetical protein